MKSQTLVVVILLLGILGIFLSDISDDYIFILVGIGFLFVAISQKGEENVGFYFWSRIVLGTIFILLGILNVFF